MGEVNRFPFPAVGEVHNYAYLFKSDAERGEIEGSKARPVLVIAAGNGRVAVMPVTTKGERTGNQVVKIPATVAKAMGLPRPDESYLLTSEINLFEWVGYDIALVPGRNTSLFGRATPGFTASALDRFRRGSAVRTTRD